MELTDLDPEFFSHAVTTASLHDDDDHPAELQESSELPEVHFYNTRGTLL